MDDMFDLTGKVALITGGSRGLGLEMARAFARNGADVIIASRNLDACRSAAEEIQKLGRRALAISVNASNWEEMNQLVNSAYVEFGRLDILVNNAGSSRAIPSHDVSEAMFDKIVSLNFKGPFRLASNVAKLMSEGQGGAIINVSSVAALIPLPTVVPYSAAKAALNAMTIALAREYAPKVRVNAIAAGPFLTDISKSWSAEDRESSPNALGRPGRPEEIVTTALYLASPASTFTTGAVFRCDGGMA